MSRKQKEKRLKKLNIWCYHEREYKKCKGRRLLRSGNLHKQVQGAELLLTAYYYRSLEIAVIAGYSNQHPFYEAYCGALLAKTKKLGFTSFRGELLTYLRKKYPVIAGRILPPGISYWTPDVEAREQEQPGEVKMDYN